MMEGIVFCWFVYVQKMEGNRFVLVWERKENGRKMYSVGLEM
jgi:hypothetical protein